MERYLQAALPAIKSYVMAPIFYVNIIFFVGAILNLVPYWQGGTLKNPDTGIILTDFSLKL